jgi:lysophospholipase L1-like esterase
MSRRTTFKILALAISLAFILAAMEVGLLICNAAGLFPDFFARLDTVRPQLHSKSGPGRYYAHPYNAYDLKPGVKGAVYTINDHGYRGKPFELTKPGGTVRIVSLGGSTTFGIGNHNHETYPYYLEEDLKQRLPGTPLEVINAGLVSATTAESLIRFALRIVSLEPDILVVYHGYNDLAPRVFDGFESDYYHFRKIMSRESPYYERFYTGRLFARKLLGRLSDRTTSNPNLLSYTWKFENLPPDESDRLRNFEETSNDIFERNMDSIIALAQARNIQVILVTFAFDKNLKNWNSLTPDPVWESGIAQNNEAIRHLSEKHHLPLVKFAERAATDPAILNDSIHMTPHGNEQMAALIADTITPIVEREMKQAP